MPAAHPGSLGGGPAASVRHGEVAVGVRLGYAVSRFGHEWPIAWQAGRDDGAIWFNQHENVLGRLAIYRVTRDLSAAACQSLNGSC